MFFFPQNVY